MIKLFAIILVISFTLPVYSADKKTEVFDLLTTKIINDFDEGVKLYNQTKATDAPAITREEDQNYHLKIKSAHVHFTIANYLNDQIYVNDRLVQKSTFGLKKTSSVFNNFFIATAFAEEGNLDAESTKIILTALSTLTNNLENVGMLCMFGCPKETRDKNLKKILKTLDSQHDDCNQQQYTQEESIKRYKRFGMVDSLHSSINSDFASIKKFLQKVSETNKSKVADFMSDKLAIDKNYQSCIGIITAGTIADGSDSLALGATVMRAGMLASEAKEAALENAKQVCIKIEELKSCLVTLKSNVNTMNSIRREVKRTSGAVYGTEQDKIPNIDNISK